MKIKIRCLITILLITLLASCSTVAEREEAPGPAGKGTRELDVRIVGESGETIPLYKDYHALVVGVSEYDHWPNLRGPVRDAEEVAGVLDDFGMNVTLMKNPASDELKNALNDLAYQKGRKEDRAILFFFSGHGETETLITGEKLGYIAPRDCPMLEVDRNGFNARAISMKMIETYALKIRSRHVLMVFDSCFSGSIFPALKGVPAAISDKINNPVRQFITAGAENEPVPDDGLFKSYFIKGVRGEADLIRDGYITGSELGLYLQDKVIAGSKGLQHPQIGRIMHPKLTGGDFIFAKAAPHPPAAPPAALTAIPPATSPPPLETSPPPPPAAPAPVTETTGKGWLTLTSEPSGASVFSDGRYLGETPLNRKRLAIGDHVIRIELPGRRAREMRWAISDGEELTRHVSLNPGFGALTIRSDPPDADAWVDGDFMGKTPVHNIELATGRHRITLKKESFDSEIDEIIHIHDGIVLEKHYRLHLSLGALTVESDPAGADVFIDDEYHCAAPCDEPLDPGDYRVRVSRDGWRPEVFDLEIAPGETTRLTANLARETGVLNIRVDPYIFNARVFVDDESEPRGAAPLTITDLPAGSYKIVCKGEKRGREYMGSEIVDVEWGKEVDATIALAAIPEREPDPVPPARVRSVEFSSEEDGRSTVFIGLSRPVEYDIESARFDNKVLLLTLYDVDIPNRQKRPLITTRYESAVDRVSPLQLPSMGHTSIFILELRQWVHYTHERSEDQIILNFDASSIPPRSINEAGLPPLREILERIELPRAEEESRTWKGTAREWEERTAPLITRSFRIDNSRAINNIKRRIKSIMSERGRIRVNQHNNRITVTDRSEVIRRALVIVEKYDRPSKRW